MADQNDNQKSDGDSRRSKSKRRYYRRKKSSDQGNSRKESSGNQGSDKESGGSKGSGNAAGGQSERRDQQESPRAQNASSDSAQSESKSSSHSPRRSRSGSSGKPKRSRRSARRDSAVDAEQAQARERRRRRRSRRSRTEDRPSIVETIAKEYSAPKDIVVYSHVSRPNLRDAYEFRSEAFANTGGRDIADFRIDISVLFPHVLDPMTPEEEAVAERRLAERAEAAKAWKAQWEATPEEEENEQTEPTM